MNPRKIGMMFHRGNLSTERFISDLSFYFKMEIVERVNIRLTPTTVAAVSRDDVKLRSREMM